VCGAALLIRVGLLVGFGLLLVGCGQGEYNRRMEKRLGELRANTKPPEAAKEEVRAPTAEDIIAEEEAAQQKAEEEGSTEAESPDDAAAPEGNEAGNEEAAPAEEPPAEDAPADESTAPADE
jgi:hypothetical protein